jgi:hypothetical protein
VRKFSTLFLAALLLLALGVAALSATGCTEANKVSANVSMEADNFNVMRRLVVLDTRTDKLMFECIGRFSINTDTADNQLEVTVEREDGKYAKHFVLLSRDTMYVVEDLSGANVSRFKYEVNYLPQSVVPFTFTTKQ